MAIKTSNTQKGIKAFFFVFFCFFLKLNNGVIVSGRNFLFLPPFREELISCADTSK